MNPTFRQTVVRARGFTLIELLVVIAIVAILSTLVVSTAGVVKARAKMSRCQSNLRQIGVGIQLYVADNRGYLPYNMNGANGVTGYGSKYQQLVTAYIPGNVTLASAWWCPAEIRDPLEEGTGGSFNSAYGLEFDPNYWPPHPSDNNKKVGYVPIPMNRLPNPSTARAVYDGSVQLNQNRLWVFDNSSNNLRHDGRANVLSYDGHVAQTDEK